MAIREYRPVAVGRSKPGARNRSLSLGLVISLALSISGSDALASGGAIKGFVRIDPTGGAITGFGEAVAEIADLDGDGVKELAVGAPFDDNNTGNQDANRGAVWILFMNADGSIKSNPPAQKLLPTLGLEDGLQFGRKLAWLGDLDATHRRALAIGAPGHDSEGAVQLALLTYSSGVVTAVFQDTGIPHARCLPGSLAPLGDFDGDSIPDLVVGNHCEGANQGAVYIVLMNANGSVKNITQIGPTNSGLSLDGLDEFGSGVAWLGTLDASHQRALAVGAHQDEVQDDNTGVVYLMFLNANGTVSSFKKIGNGGAGLPAGTLAAGDHFGFALTGLGDLDGDGIPDLAVGLPNSPYGLHGSVINLFLNTDGTVKDFQRIRDNLDGDGHGADGCIPCVIGTFDGLGTALALISDRNGDGTMDLAAGLSGGYEPNGIYQLLLSAGAVQHPAICQQVCGDKLIAGAEQCDDGNTANGDGCSASCAVEPGFTCSGCPSGPTSSCVATCGDGIVAGTEECDDGNSVNGDCCSSSCHFEAATVECRPAAGICDSAEHCSGSSGSCPTDGFASSGTPCRASMGVCDLGETCTGSSATCPADGKISAGTQCRASAGACDVAEVCDGTNNTCPADAFVSSGTVCRSAIGECDQQETCSGTSAACAADGQKPSGTACSTDGNLCTQDVCDGTGGCSHTPIVPCCQGTCGDGVVESGCEECDRGSANCPYAACCESGCSTSCKVIGTCEGGTSCCESVGQCGSGASCCGDGTVDAGEECDDGNRDAGDCCSPTCHIENSILCVTGCAGVFGPQLFSPATMKGKFTAKSGATTFSGWSVNPKGRTGSFNLGFGQSVDPRVDPVRIVFLENNGSNGSRVLGDFTIHPGDWTRCTTIPGTDDETCTLSDPTEMLSDADGVRSAKIQEKSNQIKYKCGGKTLARILKPASASGLMRACIFIGDDAGSAVLKCTLSANGKSLKCQSTN